jgi:hypothetical protein
MRDTDPSSHHRIGAPLAGWTDAINGRLYKTVLKRKTHQNMGNLFGWIYEPQSDYFKLETWYRYCAHAIEAEVD